MNLENTRLNLRDILTLKVQDLCRFNIILQLADLPLCFDLVKKYWWRWYADMYGFSYEREKRSYFIWLTTYLKNNISIAIEFFFSMPYKFLRVLGKKKYRNYLYKNSFIKKINYNLWKNSNFFNKLEFYKNNRVTYSYMANEMLLSKNLKQYPIEVLGNFDTGPDMFVSSFNGIWNNLYKEGSLFYDYTRLPSSFFIAVNSYFLSYHNFINSYDNKFIITPQKYLESFFELCSEKLYLKKYYFYLKNNIDIYKYLYYFLLKFLIKNFINKIYLFINKFYLFNFNLFLYKKNIYIFFFLYCIKKNDKY